MADHAPPRPLRAHLGAPDQLVDVQRVVVADGPARGAASVVVRNPGGVSFELYEDRALDVGWADALGVPLAWRAAQGRLPSARYDGRGDGWARTFPGGLLSTCGLAATGQPSTIDGREYGLHGRVAHLPASGVGWAVEYDDEGATAVRVWGDVTEATLGEPTLRLRRTVVADAREPRLRIVDRVINESFDPAVTMHRHHLNLGYPLVQPGTVVDGTVSVGQTRGADAPTVTLPWRLDVAAGAVAEEVHYARPAPGAAEASVTVTSPDGVRVEIAQQTAGWPLTILWRNASAGVNALGVEPSMSGDEGRAHAEATGQVVRLAPGQAAEYRTEIRVSRVG